MSRTNLLPLVLALAIICATAAVAEQAPTPGGRAGGAGTGRGNQVPAPLPTLVKIREDLFVIQNVNHTLADLGQNGSNVAVYLTDEGVVLVDAKNERMHDDIVAKVRSLTDKPIRYVILTHNHGDHTGGAARMQAIGATIVSSAGTRENMARTTQAGLASMAYTGQARIVLGGKEIHLHEVRGHTYGDTVVLFPAARVAAAGDLVTTPEGIPTIVNYGDGGSWTDLGRALDAVARLDFDVLIEGHGPNLTRAEFTKYRERAAAIRERVRALNRERKTAEEIGQTLTTELNWGMGPSAGNIPGMMLELR